jgi:hypothetical protein
MTYYFLSPDTVRAGAKAICCPSGVCEAAQSSGECRAPKYDLQAQACHFGMEDARMAEAVHPSVSQEAVSGCALGAGK